MVQRKAQTKLIIQSDHVKPEKQFGKFKPSCQLQDSKSRGSELKKKKMKKTVLSVELSDIECSKSSPLKKPGKPPPNQSVAKGTSGSPNYMKGTSSSDARRESLLLQVSSQKTRSDSDTRVLRKRNQSGSKLGSVSGNKQKKNLSRRSSLKIVRTLTKTRSFKKRSRISVCAEADLQRATCSSTLKDSKAPKYLMLNPGGTEAEGTSVLKVCPYTYCSLNGRLHKQYPPLKSFISARRRMLKTQRSSKMEACDPSNADHGGQNEVSGESEKSQVSISLSDGAPSSEIDLEENFKKISIDIDLLETLAKEDRVEDEEDVEAQTDEAGAVSVICNMELEREGVDCSKADDETAYSEMSDETSISDDVPEDILETKNDCNDARSEDIVFETNGSLKNSDIVEPSERSESSTENQDSRGDDAANSEENEQDAENLEDELALDNMGDADVSEMVNSRQCFVGQSLSGVTEDLDALEEQHEIIKVQDEAQISLNRIYVDSEEQYRSETYGFGSAENNSNEIGETEDDKRNETSKSSFYRARKLPNLEGQETCKKWIIESKIPVDEFEDSRAFNPREPNFLPVIPEPDAEKVDLKHQEIDEKKNSEEWMIDYALQKAVTKLAPARKRKVALLVEAFETVAPIPKFEAHIRKNSAVFAHGRPPQACN